MRNRMFSLFLMPKYRIFPIASVLALMAGGASITKTKAPEFKKVSPEKFDEDHADPLYAKFLLKPINYMKDSDNWKLRIISHTPDHPVSNWVNNSFPELSFENRFPLLEILYHHQILYMDVNLFVLQGLGDDAYQLLTDFFKKEGFKCISAKYNAHSSSPHYLIAYKEGDFEIKEIKQIYFTKNGSSLTSKQGESMVKEQKIGVEYDRSTQIITLSQLKKNNEEVVVVNTQAGQANENKFMAIAMERLCSELDNENRPILAMGINLFDPRINKNRAQSIYQEQIDIFSKHGFYWSSKHIYEFGMKSTFIAHPFDILHFFNKEDWKQFEEFKEQYNYKGLRDLCFHVIQRDNICLVLDNLYGVFTKNFKQAEGEDRIRISPTTLFVNERVAKICDSMEMNREDFNQKYLAGLFKRSFTVPKPLLSSDQVALQTEISSTPKLRPPS